MKNLLRLLLLCCVISSCAFARAEFKNGSFISDDEMEEIVMCYLNDLFRVAGIKERANVYFLVSPEVNAAASVGKQIIIFTGFITKCKDATQMIGVLAHETGHIAGGHPALSQNAAAQSAIPALIATALGGIAAMAGGGGDMLAAGMAAGATIFERGLLKYSRTQEESADSAALNYLEKLGWPVSGLESFLKLIDRAYSTGKEDLYAQTHPLTPDRMDKIKIFEQEKKYTGKLPDGYEEKFRRLRAKVKGFAQSPQQTLREYTASNAATEARYARAIAFYRLGKIKEADDILAKLMQDHPNDTYFSELRGQFSFEMGKLDLANSLFEKAYNRPFNGGVALMYAHCLIESNKDLSKAVELLTKSLNRNSENIFAWRLMAKAYGKMNKTADASGALAEEAWLMGDYKMAQRHAERAREATNPRIKKRALDIVAMAKNQKQPQQD